MNSEGSEHKFFQEMLISPRIERPGNFSNLSFKSKETPMIWITYHKFRTNKVMVTSNLVM